MSDAVIPEEGKASARWREIVQVIVITLTIVIPIRVFIANPFKVEGRSMEPTYFDKEYLIIDEISYRFQEPKRGEVVVLHPPTDPGKYFIKRVIGLPNETVEMAQGKVKVFSAEHPMGWVLDESAYIDMGDLSKTDLDTMNMRPVTLGTDQYFVMGDNRRASYDSRYFGPISREELIGRAWVRGWPVNRWSVLTGVPNYPVPAR
jgi:signal peptidase I